MKRLLIPFLFALMVPSVASAQLGGPNVAGYTYDVATFDYVLPPASATNLGLTDDAETTVTLPWAFPWYGVDYTTMTVGANGGIEFVGTDISNTNDCMGSGSTSAPAIAVFWDDLNPSSLLPPLPGLPATGVYSWHDTAADRFIVSWESIPHYSSFFPILGGTIQAHLYANGSVELHFESLSFFEPSVDDGGSATIGIQDVVGATDPDPLEVSCNVAGSLEGTAIGFQVCPDLDGDGHCPPEDCDDTNALISPDGVEVCGDGIDQDCVGGDLVADIDGDGFDSVACGGEDCNDGNANVNPSIDADGDGFSVCEDCVDSIPSINPDALEICDDGLDNDCDGGDTPGDADGDGIDSEACGGVDCDDTDASVHPGIDADADSFNACEDCDDSDAAIYAGNDVDADGFDACDDCDDNDPTINPDATEVCDAVDRDCDGLTLVDADGDGDGGDACGGTDCDDADPTIYAGAPELCDGIDQDCDGIDDGLDPDVGGDADSDGWVDGCPEFGDCDSGNPNIYPGAPETCNDGIDQSCNGEDATGDLDGDGFVDANCGGDDCDDDDPAINPDLDGDEDGTNYCLDCDDDDPNLWPGNQEVCADGLDQDCDGVDEPGDADGDGYVTTACIGGDDCDDSNEFVHPGIDSDGDGSNRCEDCNDNTPLQFPGNVEVCGDNFDNDCDGFADDIDADGDGHTSPECNGDDCDDTDASLSPSLDEDADGFSTCEDCDDADATSNPDGVDVCDDGIDQDCDGLDLGLDADADGYTNALCGGDDCDDLDADFNPGVEEFCDGEDHNCDGDTTTTDADNDFAFDADCGGTDCNDADPTVHPLAPEICDAQDNNCDGAFLDGGEADEDADGVPTCDGDCDDLDPDTYPNAREICDDLDNDCDDPDLPEADRIDEGIVRDRDGDGHESFSCGGGDCNDDIGDVYPQEVENLCGDGLDNDCDGDPDSTDSDCESGNAGGCGCTAVDASPGQGGLALLLLGLIGLRRRRA